ncbi:MAG: hypothetical protein HOM68_01400 [Gemmatimonadetes bacterium]|nr:hypothetical protein [Gemmatimonadota bacterium]MBT5055167.1 hypothetical protein [Gemmatimonadota bacterium]MBT5146573.1 hypothetical protein [Gemmatimonadota bacterium]MBT5591494.1 hypothetical protein [Gemmatimonadota bacterium]MBT5962051.1 hypothetical protein [Gemmatimonadota bacterium]
MADPLRIAIIATTWFPNSHAGVLATKFLTGFATDEGLIAPRTQVVSIYLDQIHDRDVGLQLAHQYDIPVFSSIRAALTHGGTELDVDAVLIIGEHGDYPLTALGQEMLPRRWFFEQVCAVIAEAGHPIPVFTDKHLAYRWQDASWMCNEARRLRIPLWAGSSIPVTWRQPDYDHPLGEALDEALSISFHMLERYGFHGLEALQCQVERRSGGESGVRTVTCLSGDDVWRAADAGTWSTDLADAALAAMDPGPDRLERDQVVDPHVFLLDYNDGFRGVVLMLGDSGYVSKSAYASRRGSTLDAFEYHTDLGPNHAHFSYFGLAIEDFFLDGVPQSPVERTLLTTGVLEAVMISHDRQGTQIETPHLDISYEPPLSLRRRPHTPRPGAASLAGGPMPEPGATPAADILPVGRDGTKHGSDR